MEVFELIFAEGSVFGVPKFRTEFSVNILTNTISAGGSEDLDLTDDRGKDYLYMDNASPPRVTRVDIRIGEGFRYYPKLNDIALLIPEPMTANTNVDEYGYITHLDYIRMYLPPRYKIGGTIRNVSGTGAQCPVYIDAETIHLRLLNPQDMRDKQIIAKALTGEFEHIQAVMGSSTQRLSYNQELKSDWRVTPVADIVSLR